MPDGLLSLPTAPKGVDPAPHMRVLLADLCDTVDAHLERLHRTAEEDHYSDAADVSTAMREARQIGRMMLEDAVDDLDELQSLYALVVNLTQRAEHVFIASDIRTALVDQDELFTRVEPHALAIGDFCGGAFMEFAINHVRNRERFHRIECQARVPLMHALMRAVSAGIAAADAQFLAAPELEYQIDNLIPKIMDVHGTIRSNDPVRHQRVASMAGTVLWNAVRINRRDGELDARNASLARRAADLEQIHADVRFQAQRLEEMPDFAFWYDVGVGFAMFQLILERLAEEQELVVPARPDIYVWYSMLGGGPS